MMLRLGAAAAVGAGVALVAVHVFQRKSARRIESNLKPRSGKPKPALQAKRDMPVTMPGNVSAGRDLPARTMSRPSSADSAGPCQCSAALNELTEFDTEAHIQCLEENYPRSVPEPVLIDLMSDVLKDHGFTSATAINLVSNCRDEICRPFTEYLDEKWGAPSFNISSLAGMVFCGRTGFKAAMAHAPVVDGKERYVFWVAPHTALSGDNVHGKVWRPGRSHESHACGALLAVQGQIKEGHIDVSLEPRDVEMSLLKQGVVKTLSYGQVPSLPELTYAVHECILDDVRKTAESTVNLDSAEYVIISGIQVHAGFSKTMFWPGSITKYTAAGVEDLYEDYAAKVAAWREEGSGQFLESEGLVLLQMKERACRLAATRGDVATLKEVENSGVALNKVYDHTKKTLLHVAVMHGQHSVVRMLLDKFGDKDKTFVAAKDREHRTALDYAILEGDDKMAKVLMVHDDGLEGDVLNDGLVKAVSTGDSAALARLAVCAKDQRSIATFLDQDGRSLVHLASGLTHKGQRKEVLQMLHSLGCDVENSADFFGKTMPRSNSLDADINELIESEN